MFQFPSNGKVYSEAAVKKARETPLMEQFQFPSNGKVYSEVHSFCLGERRWVSIPFKRESVFRASKEVLTTKNEIKVSIPFKRESVFRGHKREERLKAMEGFNSLQTGKCIQR